VADLRSALVPPGNVKVVGWMDRSQIGRLYASADLLVVPSRWEAFGLVALEGMRAGLPVVASRVGGLPEIVQDGVTGRLVDAEDPQQLAEAMVSMDAALRREMGERGRRRFLESFQIERVVEELEHVYQAAMGHLREDQHPRACGAKEGT
jgi:glycosyltransferase involved in cell wall biosynthesis